MTQTATIWSNRYHRASLEARKARILAYIQAYSVQHGHVPTMRSNTAC